VIPPPAAAEPAAAAAAPPGLSEVLGDKPQAFYGLAVAGFPNLFMINGPNTGLGHNSMIYMAECGGARNARSFFSHYCCVALVM
jgi:cation diffusion facilitator CzcD-associated flavoprotein CzcO